MEEVVARYHPRSAIHDRVRPVYIKKPVEEPAEGRVAVQSLVTAAEPLSDRKVTADVGGRKSSSGDRPVGTALVLEKRYRLEFAVKPAVMAKLERARALLSSKYPQGVELENLLSELLETYLDRHDPERKLKRRERREASKKRCKKMEKAKQTGADDNRRNRNIPEAVQDAVYARDNGRCTYRGPDGRRCNSTWNLEIDHVKPFPRGGKHTIDNLRLLCARHNRSEAERVYGEEFMKQKLKGRYRHSRE